jgi:hypothetical protein
MDPIASILVVSFLSVLVLDARNKRRDFLRKKKI